MSNEVQAPGVGKSIEAFGLKTNYLEAGEGNSETLILLHGSGPGVSAYTNWKKLIPVLAEHFHVIAPDLAGFGHTERKADFSYDMKHWGKHFMAFLDELGLEKVNLLGNSFGGSLTLAVAARFPDRFNKLCLMGTPCDKFMMTPGLRSGWDYTPSRENTRATMTHFPFSETSISDELIEDRYLTSLIPGAQEGLRKLLAKPNEEGDTELSGVPEKVVANIAHPTLVLHGREDKVVPTEMGFKLGRSMPNADMHILANCGHWVMAERPDAFIRLVIGHFS